MSPQTKGKHAMAAVSISKRLLSTVLTSYILLSVFIMIIHLFSTYLMVKAEVTEEIRQLESTINVSLSQAIWEINDEQIDAIGSGLTEMSFVDSVFIFDENQAMIYQSDGPDEIPIDVGQLGEIEYEDYFGYLAKLHFSFTPNTPGTEPNSVGYIAIVSNNSIVYSAMKIQVLFSLLSALLSVILISFLIKYLFHVLLTTPLEDLSHNIASFDLDNLTKAQLTPPTAHNDELFILTRSFNSMLAKLGEYKENLELTKQQLIEANTLLDQQNTFLEVQVSNKTAILSETVDKLATQKKALELNEQELLNSLEQLKKTQYQLVESEKMASLGGLVAGISHEINTPVGIGVTAVSYLRECLVDLEHKIDTKTLSQSDMNKFITDANNCSSLLLTNLEKASQLIQSFKDISVDQTSEAHRNVDLVSYLDEVLVSLQPKLKRANHHFEITGEKELIIFCQAGAISQIYTNLILNSLIHAFPNNDSGTMAFHFARDQENITITYQDNGVGLSPNGLEQLFEPFYTTRRGQGGSGLGTHILYNIVTQALNGKIHAASEVGKGLKYTIEFPIPQAPSARKKA